MKAAEKKNSQKEFYKNTAEAEPEFINRTYRLNYRNAQFLDQFVLKLQLKHKIKVSRNEVMNTFIEILEEKLDDINGDITNIKSTEDIKNLFFNSK